MHYSSSFSTRLLQHSHQYLPGHILTYFIIYNICCSLVVYYVLVIFLIFMLSIFVSWRSFIFILGSNTISKSLSKNRFYHPFLLFFYGSPKKKLNKFIRIYLSRLNSSRMAWYSFEETKSNLPQVNHRWLHENQQSQGYSDMVLVKSEI